METTASQRNLTPMMEQYFAIRNTLEKDTVLLFRLGDFYEMFHEDAQVGSRILGITLTKRGETPMAGIPFHTANNYVGKFLEAGIKVAICDQTESAQAGKLVKREITRILTPGTLLEAEQLTENASNYLMSLQWTQDGLAAAWMDLSVGECTVAFSASPENLFPLLYALNPREVLVSNVTTATADESHEHKAAWDQFCTGKTLSEISHALYKPHRGFQQLCSSLGMISLDGFGIEEKNPALGAAGALFAYATGALRAESNLIRRLRVHHCEDQLIIDPVTTKALEVFESAHGTYEGSLCDAMDATVTAAGGRLLRQWLATPLISASAIAVRQRLVNEARAHPQQLGALRTKLAGVRDIRRILSRLQHRLRSPREVGAICQTLGFLPEIRECCFAAGEIGLRELGEQILPLNDLRNHLERALSDDLPVKIDEGGYIRAGFDSILDQQRLLTSGHQSWISELEVREQKVSGIRTLKIKYHGSIGYCIEVSKGSAHLVPAHYVRRQTMTSAERFTTPELKAKEHEILHAQEKALAREREVLEELVSEILFHGRELEHTAQVLAELDVLCGWAYLARQWNYVCPIVNESTELTIEAGRHPVIEQCLAQSKNGLAGLHQFVPNGTALDATSTQIALITGPNMAGKSTYIRQVALMTLMAQVGAFVPAKSFCLGVVDRIFARIGASDELSRGHSTFMVEMSETANILNNASPRSLIILDEIGRGTSTYDGLSIAWAVIEHLHTDAHIGPRTLFATHYHELTQLDQALPRLRNFCAAVQEHQDQVIFLRQIIAGAADRSYGIQVARLAGLPVSVIDRAKVILTELETEGLVRVTTLDEDVKANRMASRKKISGDGDLQVQLGLGF
jgi:DNA mismatch repair protein MutS